MQIAGREGREPKATPELERPEVHRHRIRRYIITPKMNSIASGEIMIDRPRGVRRASRSCASATAEAPVVSPGIRRVQSGAHRRVPSGSC